MSNTLLGKPYTIRYDNNTKPVKVIENENFDNEKWHHLTFNDVEFINCTFVNTFFEHSLFYCVRFSKCDLTGTSFYYSTLDWCTFTKSSVMKGNFNYASINNIITYYTDFTDATFHKAYIDGFHGEHGNYTNVDFRTTEIFNNSNLLAICNNMKYLENQGFGVKKDERFRRIKELLLQQNN